VRDAPRSSFATYPLDHVIVVLAFDGLCCIDAQDGTISVVNRIEHLFQQVIFVRIDTASHHTCMIGRLHEAREYLV
jgi:hypothetical protein